MATIAEQLITIANIKAAIHASIVAKGQAVTADPFAGYSAAIDAITTGGASVPAMIADMPFTAGTEPTTGNVWYVKPDGEGLKDGTNWSNAFATRQEAVNAASSGDRVYVWEGTYYLTAVQTPKAGVSEYYGFNGDGTWATRQPFTNPSKHDAGFTSNNYTNDVGFAEGQVVDGLWIQNLIGARAVSCGGTTNLKNCVMIGGDTGGLVALGTVSNCFIANFSSSGSGGGVFMQSGSLVEDILVFNCSTSSNGGGIYAQSTSRTIRRCRAINCFAFSGGGFYVNSVNIAPYATISDSQALNCYVKGSGAQGGGFYLVHSARAVNTSAINCAAPAGGGGFYCGAKVNNINSTAIFCSNGFYCGALNQLYNCVSWGGSIYIAEAGYAYKIYNCASDSALTGVSGWDTNADVRDFLSLSTFPFAAAGVAPFDAAGAFYQSLPQGEEALAFIDRVVVPSLTNPRPHSTSLLIGAGYYEAGVTPDIDADGNERPLTPSIGAYEYVEEA